MRLARTDPRKPTLHLPGSPEKIAIMMLRDTLGIPLYHPQDRGRVLTPHDI